VAVSVNMLIKENIFNTNSACLAQAMATCKKLASCNFYLNTWRCRFSFWCRNLCWGFGCCL